jgi:hypothetical protein
VTDCIKHFDLNGISYLEVLMSWKQISKLLLTKMIKSQVL